MLNALLKSIKLKWNFYVDWFDEEGDDLEQLIKSHFLSSAMFLEEEAVSFPSSRFYRQGRYCQLNSKPAVNVQLSKHGELISLNVLLKIN